MGAAVEVELEVHVPRSATVVSVAGSIVGAVVLLLFVPELTGRKQARPLRPPPGVGILQTLLGGMGTLLGGSSFHRARVRIDDTSVRFGQHLIARSGIRAAWWSPPAGNTPGEVHLMGEERRTLALLRADAEVASSLLDALQLDPGRATATFTAIAPSWSAAWFAALAVIGGGVALTWLLVASGSPILAGLTILAALIACRWMLRTGIVVGADGLRVDTRLGKRFLSWSSVASVSPCWRGVALDLHRRQWRKRLPMTPFVLLGDRAAHRRGLLERATRALLHHGASGRLAAESRLERRARAPAAWLRDLFDRSSHFRDAPLLDDELWEVVESPAASATARAGAAAVLARGAPEETRGRLRIAAATCTEPRLRIVLERAANAGSNAELEAAMTEVTDTDESNPATGAPIRSRQ